jgi:hypothetical protein
MGELHRSAASLGFYGDDLDPKELSERLGGVPTVGVRKGGTWLTARGVEKMAHTGSWRIHVADCAPADLDGQINDLLDGLTDDLSAWRTFAQRYRGRIFLGLFLETGNEGVSLRPETLMRVGERGLLIDFDIYSAADF